MSHAFLRDVSRPAPSPPDPSVAAEAFEGLFVPAPALDRRSVADMLRRVGVRLALAPDFSAAARIAAEHPLEWALVDLADEAHALAAIRLIRARQPRLRMAALVDEAGAVTAGQARLAGVTDLLPWPSQEPEVAAFVADIRDRIAAADVPAEHPHAIVACSSAMRETMRLIRAAAAGSAGVVLQGETGSGRRLVARALHDLSGPSARPFVVVDAGGGRTAREIETQLFGDAGAASVRGTSRTPLRLDGSSAVHAALGGTLCLAGISHLTPRVQTRLTRLLRDGETTLDDGTRVEERVRLVATDAGADEAGDECRLRPEFAAVLSGPRIAVPPLRRRRQDIPMLAAHLLHESRPDIGGAAISRSALLVLAAMAWPGNGPELRDAMRRLARAARGPVIQIDDVLELTALETAPPPPLAGASLRAAKATFERECISRVIVRHRGRMGEAAKALGIQRTNLYRKVRQLNIERSLFATRK